MFGGNNCYPPNTHGLRRKEPCLAKGWGWQRGSRPSGCSVLRHSPIRAPFNSRHKCLLSLLCCISQAPHMRLTVYLQTHVLFVLHRSRLADPDCRLVLRVAHPPHECLVAPPTWSTCLPWESTALRTAIYKPAAGGRISPPHGTQSPWVSHRDVSRECFPSHCNVR